MNPDVFAKWAATLAPKLIKNLEARKFEAYYCQTGEEAAQKALSLIPQGDCVSWGGSMTLGEIGLYDMVRRGGFKIIDRDTAKTPEERTALMRQALTCDTFLTSFNAVSEDGVLINVDGMGNRVAAITYGPRQVIAVVGMNKVCKTVEDAHARARGFASPINAIRLGIQGTPCAVTGGCANCTTDGCVCSYISETRMCKVQGRIKVILVGQPLGY